MTRIERWAIDKKLIPDAQFGFHKNHNTADCIFILKTYVDVIIPEQCLYICSVDFCKDFDRVRQNVLWRKLGKLGLNKKMRNTLETIYKRATVRVKE